VLLGEKRINRKVAQDAQPAVSCPRGRRNGQEGRVFADAVFDLVFMDSNAGHGRYEANARSAGRLAAAPVR